MLQPRQAQRLYGRLELVANAVALTGVQVLFNRPASQTDGDRIEIGRCPQSSVERFLRLATAYVIHEAGHVWLTDFELWRAMSREVEITGQKAIRSLSNCIEDGRIENAIMAELPGSRVHLCNLVSDCVSNGRFAALSADKPAWALEGYVLYLVRDRWCHQPGVGQLALDGRGVLIELIGEDAVSQIDGLIGIDSPCGSTKDSISLARKIYKIAGEGRQQSRRHKEGSGDGSKPSQPPEALDNDQSAQKPDSDSTLTDFDEQGDELSGDADGIMEQVRELLNSMSQAAKSSGSTIIVPDVPEAHGLAIEPNRQSHEQLPSDRGGAGLLRSSLRRILIDRSRSRTAPARNGRRLHRGRLAGSAAGRADVMRRTTVGTTPDACVSILVDFSSSMTSEGRIGMALSAALTLGKALDGIPGIDFSVSGYTANGSYPKIFTIKTPSQPLTSSRGRFVRPATMGTTPTGEGLVFVNRQIAMTSRRKKLVILLTDGLSNGGFPVSAAFLQGRAMGIQYRCIGIREDLPDEYQCGVRLEDLDDLPEAILGYVSDLVAA